jgi:uncharacterized protein (TIGR00255 family)
MESMTGYCYVEKNTEQFSYSIEIKSLNSKYFESIINLPKTLRNEENEIQTLLKKYISRGKIVVNIDIFEWIDAKPVSVNGDLIVKYYNEIQKVHDRLMIKEPFHFDTVLQLDGITQRERSMISDKSRNDIYSNLTQAVKKTVAMRKKEGSAIKKDINHSLGEISKNVTTVKNRAVSIVKEKSDALRERILSIAGDSIDETRLYTEIAILADRIDINEEIIRLSDHLKKFKSVIKDDEQIGKKCDFIAQEMFREVNTIASKSNSSEISHIVVDMKNHIDKIREHARNIV